VRSDGNGTNACNPGTEPHATERTRKSPAITMQCRKPIESRLSRNEAGADRTLRAPMIQAGNVPTVAGMADGPIPERRRNWNSNSQARLAELERKWSEQREQIAREQLPEERSETSRKPKPSDPAEP
jgi:hypothetical protein